MSDPPKKTRQLQPYSRPKAIANLDGRTREAKHMLELRKSLVQHVGGSPSATQAMLIEQAVMLSLRLAVMDRTFSETGNLTEHDTRTYLAWANSLSRLMRQLGMKGEADRAPSIRDFITKRGEP